MSSTEVASLNLIPNHLRLAVGDSSALDLKLKIHKYEALGTLTYQEMCRLETPVYVTTV